MVGCQLLVGRSGGDQPPDLPLQGSDDQMTPPMAATSVTDMFPALGGNENHGDLDRSDRLDNRGRL